jgi:hypothetical protein
MDTLSSYLDWNVVTAALAVIALLVVVLLVFRAFSGTVRGRRGARLAISEYHEVDKTRRLLLVRRDGVEHLLMIGGAHDLVIETGIEIIAADERDDSYLHRPPVSEPALQPSPPRRTEEPPLRGEQEEGVHAPVPLRPAPRPPVFGNKAPPKLRPIGREEPRLQPVREYNDEQK